MIAGVRKEATNFWLGSAFCLGFEGTSACGYAKCSNNRASVYLRIGNPPQAVSAGCFAAGELSRLRVVCLCPSNLHLVRFFVGAPLDGAAGVRYCANTLNVASTSGDGMMACEGYTVLKGITATWYVMAGATIVSRHRFREDAVLEAERLLRRRGRGSVMTYVIRIEGFASGAVCPFAGRFVKAFDHDAGDGRGEGEFTSDARDAKRFSSRASAFLFWRKQSRKRPLRADGSANRPMTCSTVVIGPLFEFLI